MYVYDKTRHVKLKTKQLADLVVSMLRIFPQHTTTNRFKEPSFSIPQHQQSKMQNLFRMLVHTSTIMNENYRSKDKYGRYMSQKEDYINALNLMKDLVLYFDIRKGQYEHELLSILQAIQEQQGKITSRYIEEFTGYSRSQCKRIITLFLDRGWMERTGGNKKTGYTYKLTE